MTSLLQLLFPKLEFPATVESFNAILEPGEPGDDREREEHLIAALEGASAAASSKTPSREQSVIVSDPKKLEF